MVAMMKLMPRIEIERGEREMMMIIRRGRGIVKGVANPTTSSGKIALMKY